MRFVWRCVLVIAALVAGSLLLAACGGEEEEEAGASTTATPAAATEEAVVEEEGAGAATTATPAATPAAATEEAVVEEEGLDLDQYFRRLEDITDATITGVSMLKSQGVGEDIQATRNYADSFNAIVKQTLNDLRDIHPPGEAQDAHDEFVAALAAGLAVWEDLSDRLADLESPSGLEALLAEFEPSFGATSERSGNACLELQGIADDNGIDVDLECD